MKVAIAIIFALVCLTAKADDPVHACKDTTQWLDGTTCKACSAGCNNCVAKDKKEACISCAAKKFLDDSLACKDCIANCDACRGADAAACATPSAEYKLAPSGLFKCPASLTGCLYCSAEGKCGKCQYGYRLDKEACTPCNVNTCLDCSDDVAKCKKCAYWNTLKDDKCTTCDFGCKDCPCTGCKDGFAFKDGKCTLCTVAGCTACAADAGKCTACMSGYFLDKETCTKCGDGCETCTAADKCTKCKSRFGAKDGKCTACPTCAECDGDGKCTKCDTGYFKDGDKCTACSTGCIECSAADKCSKCTSTGYFKDGDKCTACSASCTTCTAADKCTACNSGFMVVKDSCKSYRDCAFGQGMKEDGTCDKGTIDNCAYGNLKEGSCGICADGFVAKDKTCANCPNGCKACSADSKGYVTCTQIGQVGYSIVTDNSGKSDKMGYLGKDVTYQLDRNGGDAVCMQNTWLATYTKDFNKHKCFAYDSCPMVTGQVGHFECFVEGNAIKMTLSLFAVVVATLFTL